MTTLEKKRNLMSILSQRKHWEKDGRKPYGSGKDHQYIWDSYRDGLSPLEDWPDVYRFSVQISDSPDGDCWWSGECRFLNGDTDVEILNEECNWN